MTDTVDGYATAFLEVARAEGELERVSDELFLFARGLERADDLYQTLTDQNLPAEKRQTIVLELLGPKALPITGSLVAFVVGAGRTRDLVAIIDRLVQKAAAEVDKEVAEVHSSVPLDEDQQKRLAKALSENLGKQVEVKVVVDPDVLGGLMARVGDTVIDGTVRHRLDQLRESM